LEPGGIGRQTTGIEPKPKHAFLFGLGYGRNAPKAAFKLAIRALCYC
jgi:hypothetical protein